MAYAKKQESCGVTTTTSDMESTSEVSGILAWLDGVLILEEEPLTTPLNYFKLQS